MVPKTSLPQGFWRPLLTTAAANLYQHRAVSAPLSAASKLEKAQKSSGFRARNICWIDIKDRIIIEGCIKLHYDYGTYCYSA